MEELLKKYGRILKNIEKIIKEIIKKY